MLIRPFKIPKYIRVQQKSAEWFLSQINDVRENILRVSSDKPEVTIVIPAFNEEHSILRCLSSLSKSITSKKIEILVVNNNSTDRTQELVERSGARYVIEYKQGVKHARNAGLAAARGEIILNADADSVYSPFWVELLTKPLDNQKVACSYGRFSFLPDQPSRRFWYFLYECAGDLYKNFHQIGRDRAMYVYGCSSCFRKVQGVQVDGYEHPLGANEDGFLALKLRNTFGKLYKVDSADSLVWTSDRRLMEQGGLINAFISRVRNVFRKA